jgi:hypothetical protein
MSIMPIMAFWKLTQHSKGQKMNTHSHFTAQDIIDSLLNDRHDNVTPVIPDGLIDLSPIAHTLRTLSKDGRALHSNENYSIGEMLGQLLQAFIPDEANNDNLTTAILGLTVLLARVLRAVPQLVPDVSIEEFLIEPTDQDKLIQLAQAMSATPLITAKNGQLRPAIAQLSIFHQPVTITEQAINGFITRQIEPYDDLESPETANLAAFLATSEPPVEIEEWISDPLNGFDEFFDSYFDRQDHNDEFNDEN